MSLLWFLLDSAFVMLVCRAVGKREVSYLPSLFITAAVLFVLIYIRIDVFFRITLAVTAMGLLLYKFAGVSPLRSMLTGVVYIAYKFALIWIFTMGFRM